MPGYRIQSISKTGWKGLICPWASGELAAFKHMGITASAGKRVFSQEKCCPSKTPGRCCVPSQEQTSLVLRSSRSPSAGTCLQPLSPQKPETAAPVAISEAGLEKLLYKRSFL